jgi:hypothetical protein
MTGGTGLGLYSLAKRVEALGGAQVDGIWRFFPSTAAA